MRRHLPPLPPLRAFEAVARLGSFTRAAEELSVTQSAVSHQIRALEDHFAIRLFERRTPGIALTEAGRDLLPHVQDAFGRLAAAADRLSQRGRQGVLRVAATPAFATGWLVPRLGQFAARHPEIEVRLSIHLWSPDPVEDGADLAIGLSRAGATDPTDGLELVAERVFPVCAPRLLPLLARPEALAEVTLLHEEAPSYDALDWAFWFRRLGIGHLAPRRAIHLSHFSLVVAAALDGVGVALGRLPLIAAEIESGRLVRPLGDDVGAGSMVHVARWRPGGLDDMRVAAFRDWLFEEVAAAAGERA